MNQSLLEYWILTTSVGWYHPSVFTWDLITVWQEIFGQFSSCATLLLPAPEDALTTKCSELFMILNAFAEAVSFTSTKNWVVKTVVPPAPHYYDMVFVLSHKVYHHHQLQQIMWRMMSSSISTQTTTLLKSVSLSPPWRLQTGQWQLHMLLIIWLCTVSQSFTSITTIVD